MADNTFDPKRLAEYQAILSSIEGILGDIINKDQSIIVSAAEKDRMLSERKAKLETVIRLKFEELESSGKLLDNEERRNALLTQHRANLQQQLSVVTTSYHENKRALEDAELAVRNIDAAMDELRNSSSGTAAEMKQLEREYARAKLEVSKISLRQIQLSDTERQKIVSKITAEMQYTDAKLKSSQAVQSSMTTLFGLDNKWRQTLAGSLFETLSAARKAQGTITGLASTLAHLSTTLSNVGSFGNVLGSSISKVTETTVMMVGQIDRADVGLRSATGASKEFATGLSRAFEDREIRNMAASYEELRQVQTALYSIGREYSNVYLPEQRDAMDRAAMAAKRFGVAFDTSAMVMDRSKRIFGVEGPEMLNRLYNSAIAIGETPARMIQNFTQTLDVMSQYSGPRAIQVLQGLSAIAKQTGIEMNVLTGVARQFDTFETAAGSVAKLNAILGGAYFNSIQMLNASEEQRLYLLRAGLDATNKSWESLGRWEKKALAAAAGFKDMSIAAAFFTGNMAKVEELTREQERQAMIQGQLVAAGGQVVDIFKQIARVFQDAGIGAKWVVKWVRAVVDVMKTLGMEGIIAAKLIWGVANSFMAAKIQAAAFAGVLPGATVGMRSLGMAMAGLAPLAITAGAAWLYFSSKMKEESSPAAWQLPSIAAQGLGALGENARRAAPEINTLANRINSLNDRKVVSLTRALGTASQISAPNLNFAQVTAGISELTRAVNTLDESKIDKFSSAMSRLGYVMRTIPKENVVAVTQLTKESRMVSALPAMAAARAGAQISAQGFAVRAARASEAPHAGGRSGGTEGVLVTDSITVNVGGTLLTQRIKDTVHGMYSKMGRA